MSSKDPFLPASRWRMLPVPALAVAFLALVVSMGLVSPTHERLAAEDLRAQVVSDFYRLQHAASAFAKDNAAFPPAAFDLTGGLDGALTDRSFVPATLAATWKGPYLTPPMGRPTRNGFWSLAEPCCMRDADGDGAADELWARLNRGSGEIDDESAGWLDRVLDDGGDGTGTVRVTPTWIWFQLVER